MSGDLFERPRTDEITDDERAAWTLDRAITVFLNRWTWRADRATVEQELRELIAEVRSSGVERE